MAHKPNVGTLRLHSELRTLSLTNKEVQESLSDKTFCRRSLQKSTKRVTSSFYHFGRSQMSADPCRRHCKRDMSYRADPRFQGQMSGARGSICGRILGDERVDDLHICIRATEVSQEEFVSRALSLSYGPSPGCVSRNLITFPGLSKIVAFYELSY